MNKNRVERFPLELNVERPILATCAVNKGAFVKSLLLVFHHFTCKQGIKAAPIKCTLYPISFAFFCVLTVGILVVCEANPGGRLAIKAAVITVFTTRIVNPNQVAKESKTALFAIKRFPKTNHFSHLYSPISCKYESKIFPVVAIGSSPHRMRG